MLFAYGEMQKVNRYYYRDGKGKRNYILVNRIDIRKNKARWVTFFHSGFWISKPSIFIEGFLIWIT